MNNPNANIGDLILELAHRQPAAPALHVPGRTSLTYAALGAQIRYVRERLGHWNIGPGDLVAACIPARPEMALVCAAIPAVATLVPLSPALATDAYCSLLERLRPKALLVPKGVDHAARIAARTCGVSEIELNAERSDPAGMFSLELRQGQASLARTCSARPEWAYVLATSGTTGRPKLVPISHTRMALNTQYQADWLRFLPGDVGCHLVPMHHSLGLSSALLVPLLRGASVVCLPESDIDGFFAALDEYSLTWLPASFTHHHAILRQAPLHRATVARNNLRCIRTAAGRLEPEEIDAVEQMFGAPVLTGFSMTEAFTITHEPLPPRIRKRGSVGVPVINQVAIMNPDKSSCAAETLGQVVVRGPLVFDGYVDDAQATAASFPDGWFWTGDLGYFDQDGYLFLQGRAKDVINRGGKKISPMEVDAAIASHPAIHSAATFAVPHPTLGEEFAAAVIKHPGQSAEEAELIEWAKQRTTSGLAPRRIFFVEELPKTDLGKVRRSELPRLLGLDRPGAPPADESAVRALAPNSALEAALMGLWLATLRVSRIGIDDDFFLLGGDSLRGAQLLAHVNAVFGVELTLHAMFTNAATVAGMARAIEAARVAAASPNRI